MVPDRTRILLISPQFNAKSIWSLKKTCEVAGFKYPTAPLGLLTMAAMLPPSWEIRFVDRNADELAPDDFEWADLVMAGGMLPQQHDLLHLIELAHAHNKPIALGGADVTSSPHLYAAADFRVLGEAELVIDDFIAVWQSGARTGVFEAPKFQADVTTTPIPRYDLLKFSNYAFIGVQFSRGCPFNCEFCDIIELFGRVPRTKKPAQVLSELDRLYELGYRGHVDFVDDNLIGNKKALRELLPELNAWQRKHNYPFAFSTEASVNLADDAELLADLQESNFFWVYVGVESPDTDTLVSIQKKQNTRRSLVESLRKINASGLMVNAGFILGFDSEKGSAAEGILDYIEAAPLPIFMLSLLYALPNTQLTKRLQREGRLHADHEVAPKQSLFSSGLNFTTARPRRDILVDYRTILEKAYAPAAFFGRTRRLIDALKCPPHRSKPRPREVLTLLRLIWHMTVQRPELLFDFWRTLLRCVVKNPNALGPVCTSMLIYAHIGPFSRYLMDRIDEDLAAIDSGAWQEPALMPRTAEVEASLHAV